MAGQQPSTQQFSNAHAHTQSKHRQHTESSVESCGFALHVTIVSASVFLIIISFTGKSFHYDEFDVDNDGGYWREIRDLIPDSSIVLAAVKLLLWILVATPFVYTRINCFSVPEADSIDTICDDFDYLRYGVMNLSVWYQFFSLTYRLYRLLDSDKRTAVADLDVAHINDCIWESLRLPPHPKDVENEGSLPQGRRTHMSPTRIP